MPILTRTVNAPLIVEIDTGIVPRLQGVLDRNALWPRGKAAAVVGTGQGPDLAPLLPSSLPGAAVHTVEGGSLDAARALRDEFRAGDVDVVVAIGGGGTIDVAKWAATMHGLPLLAVPTSLSHDGIASPVGVLSDGGHTRSYGLHTPLGVIVDLDLVARAPGGLLRSGVGDVTANLSALEDWKLASEVRGESVDGLAVALAGSAGTAVATCDGVLGERAFLCTLAHSLVLSGMAMSVAGSSRPCSGACHEISHAIDRLFPGTAAHGGQVAVGALFGAFLRNSPTLSVLDRCYRRHGVPRRPQDLGLTVEQFAEAVHEAPATRPGRLTILEHLDLDPPRIAEHVDAFLDTITR